MSGCGSDLSLPTLSVGRNPDGTVHSGRCPEGRENPSWFSIYSRPPCSIAHVWGAPKIRERLRVAAPTSSAPAIGTVHAVLDRHGLVTRRKRRRHRDEATTLSQATQPNDLWCADYKGEFMLANRRYCYPLTITDFATRYLIICDASRRPQPRTPSVCSSGPFSNSGCRGRAGPTTGCPLPADARSMR
jgi:putative transposase